MLSLRRLFVCLALSLAACQSPNPLASDGGPGGGGSDGGNPGPGPSDGGGGGGDLASPPGAPGDGTPTRQACTSSFGNAITTTFGRLDGTLVSIVPPGHAGCNSDSDHLHLQILMNGKVYDIAAAITDNTLPIDVLETDLSLPDGAWQEGWHTNVSLDYVSLGYHSTAFSPIPKAQLVPQLESALGNVNHISVFATGYGPGGAHLVHRNGGGHDGAIVIHPLSTPSHAWMFHFEAQSF